MNSYPDDNKQDELFTLRLKNKQRTISQLSHPGSGSNDSRGLISNNEHNQLFCNTFVCPERNPNSPSMTYLSDYTKAMLICEETFLQKALTPFNHDEFKQSVIKQVQQSLCLTKNSILINEIDKYIDSYIQREQTQHLKSCQTQLIAHNDLKNQLRLLKEEIAVMDLEHYTNQSRSHSKKKKKKRLGKYTNANSTTSNFSFENNKTYNDNSMIRNLSSSVDNNNCLVKKIMIKDKEKEREKEKDGNSMITNNELTNNSDIMKLSTSKSVIGNSRGIVSRIFSSVYEEMPKLYLNYKAQEEIIEEPSMIINDFKSSCNDAYKLPLSTSTPLLRPISVPTQLEEEKKSHEIQGHDKENKSKGIVTTRSNMNSFSEIFALQKQRQIQGQKPKQTMIEKETTSQQTYQSSVKTMKKKDTKAYKIDTGNSSILMKYYQGSLKRNTSVPRYRLSKNNKPSIKPYSSIAKNFSGKISFLKASMMAQQNPNHSIRNENPHINPVNTNAVSSNVNVNIKSNNTRSNSHKPSLVHTNTTTVPGASSSLPQKNHTKRKEPLRLFFKRYSLKITHDALLLCLLKASAVYNKSSKPRQKQIMIKVPVNNFIDIGRISQGKLKTNDSFFNKTQYDKSAHRIPIAYTMNKNDSTNVNVYKKENLRPRNTNNSQTKPKSIRKKLISQD